MNYQLFLYNQAIYGFNSWIYQITVATYLYKETHSTVSVSIQLIISLMSSLLSSLMLNNVTKNQKYVFVQYIQNIAVISAVTVAILAYNKQLTPQLLYIVAMINGFAHSSYTGIRSALLMEFNLDKQLLTAINFRVNNFNKTVAPALTGVLLLIFGSMFGFFLNGILLVINRVVLHVELKKLGTIICEPFSFKKLMHMSTLLQNILRKDGLRKYYIFFGVLFSGYTVVLPSLIYHSLKLNEIMFSLTYVLTGIAGMSNSYVFSKIQPTYVKVYLKLCIFLISISICALMLNGYFHQTYLTFISLFVVGFSYGGILISLDFLNYQKDKENYLQRNATFALIVNLCNVLSYIIYSQIMLTFFH